MFTRYKGIEIPQNYSGNRFRNEAPVTETKTHKPSVSSSTKTSISPSFESVLRHGTIQVPVEQIVEDVSDFYENEMVAEEVAPTMIEEAPLEEKNKEGTLFDDFKPIVSSIIKNVNSEDLLLLSLIVLLMSEGNEDSNDVILPLLLLFLYR